METKNKIIVNFSRSLAENVNTILSTSMQLNDEADENMATIKTLNVLIDSLRSQTVLIQQAIDEYHK